MLLCYHCLMEWGTIQSYNKHATKNQSNEVNMKAREHLPWVPLQPDNHLHASLENDVTSFLVDTSIYRKNT